MAKLTPRYTKYELETSLMCIKPVERWTAAEHKAWAKDCTGFRHFTASNITPIERGCVTNYAKKLRSAARTSSTYALGIRNDAQDAYPR
jgi:hypothetical protein